MGIDQEDFNKKRKALFGGNAPFNLSEKGFWPVDFNYKSLKGKKTKDGRDAQWGLNFAAEATLQPCMKCGRPVASPNNPDKPVWFSLEVADVIGSTGKSGDEVRKVCGKCQDIMSYNYQLAYHKDRIKKSRHQRRRGDGIKRFASSSPSSPPKKRTAAQEKEYQIWKKLDKKYHK